MAKSPNDFALPATQGFPSDPGSMRLLMDDGVSEAPTRQNILNAVDWLVEGAQSGDSLFFHYSGHGGQEVRDADGRARRPTEPRS